MKTKEILQKAILMTAICVVSGSVNAQSAESFNFQGEFTDSADEPIVNSSVVLGFSIFDPTGNCLLYQEKQTVDLSNTAGHFSVAIGSAIGHARRSGTNDPGLAMTNIFRNSGGAIRASSTPQCVPGYTPSATDSRKIQVTIIEIDGTAINQALTMSDLNSVPMAALAISYSPVSDWSNNNFRITNLVSPSAGTDAVNKTYADTNLKGIAISGSPTSGQVLQYNGSNWIPTAMGGGGTVTTVTVSAPLTVATPTTTPNITIPQATGGVSGYLSSADWTTFNNKLGTTLPSGYVWVGNGSNVATPVTITGDGTINSSGVLNLNTVPITKGGTGTTAIAPNRLVGTNGGGSQLQAVTCSLNQVVSFDGAGNYMCQNVSSLFSGSPLVQNGNSLAQNISMGTNDAYSLNLLTGGLPTMTLSPTQNVGIGTTSPSELLDIETSNASPRGIHVRNNAGGTGAAMAKFEDAGGRSTVVFQNTTSGPFAGGVAHAGGITTMTSSSALILGTNNTERLRIDANNGNVGVGTIPSSYAKLQVNGSIVAGINTVPSGNTADFTYGNTIILQSIGGSSITLLGMIAGGKYTIVVEDATSRTYTFTGCPGTVRFSPANGFTTASYHSIYEFFVTGTNCYVKWASGF